MRPSFLAPIFTRTCAPDVGPVARNTSSRVITIFTGRPALLRQRQRQRLEVDDGLAAEAAADLGRGHAHLADVPAEQPRAVGAHDQWPCVDTQTSAWPSSDTLAMQACGSM